MTDDDLEREFRRILKEKRRIVRGLEQMIRDTNHWNGLPQAAGHELDMENIRVALYHSRSSVELSEAGKTAEAAESWRRAKDAGRDEAARSVSK